MSINKMIFYIAACMLLCKCSPLPHIANDQANEITTTEYGRSFLAEHSFAELKIVIQFVHDPSGYIEAVEDIQGISDYLSVYRRYFNEKAKAPSDFYDFFLRKQFGTINAQKIRVLTFLLIKCQKSALFSELLADVYTNYFSIDPSPFINDLKKRTEWKAVFDSLISASWLTLETGLKKMGFSEFENEIREYINSMRRISKYGRRN